MKINVTAEHIEGGAPCHGSTCPIAWAVRAITGAGWVEVTATRVYVNGEILGYMPEIATEFVYRFDADRPVAPFAFDLDTD